MPDRCLAIVALCAVPCLEACGPDVEGAPAMELPPVVWSGEHLDYAPEPSATPVCAGTLPYMDRYLGLMAEELGVHDLGRYVYVHGPTTACPGVGCFHEGVIYAEHAPLEHELLHAVAGELAAVDSLDFFEEGAAELFGGDLELRREYADGDLREGFAAGKGGWFPGEWYTPAGIFAAYLHRHHGGQLIRALLERTTEATTPDEAAALLEELTAMPFDALAADFGEHVQGCSERLEPARYRYPVFPCDAPEAVRPRCDGERAVPIEMSLRCDDPETIGPRRGELFGYVAIDIPADGTYRFTAVPREAGVGARIELKRCEAGCGTRPFSTAYGDVAPEPLGAVYLDREQVLRAGRYSLKVARDGEPAMGLAIVIAGEDCR